MLPTRRLFFAVPLSQGLAAFIAIAQEAPPVRHDADTGLGFRITGNDGPVIVLESATATPMANWDAVVAALASCARLLTYDRLGTGASAPVSTGKVRAEEVGDRLRRLLRNLRLPTPIILVGHSIAGLYVQDFARRFPHEVAGVVLVDATSPLEPPGMFVPASPPPPGTTAAAEEAGVAESIESLRRGPAFPPVPLIVLSATKHGDTPERERLWQQVQERTAALSPRGRHVVVDSGHFVQQDRPEAVVEAIRSIACR